MNEHHPTTLDADPGRRIQDAGPRPQASADAAARAYAAARGIWRTQQERRRRRQSAMAAALVLAAGLPLYLWLPLRPEPAPPATPAPVVASASLDNAVGSVRLAGAALVYPLAAGTALAAGHDLETGADGRAALRLRPAVSVRLDHDTRLKMVSAERLELERGALYVDAADGRSLEIVTPFGVVRDLGTQFETRVEPGRLSLKVREGRVALAGKTPAEAGAGEKLEVDDQGNLERLPLRPEDATWRWARELATPPPIEGRPLGVLLDWYARERGLPWRYPDPAFADQARAIVLHGDLRGLSPDEALTLALEGSGLRMVEQESALRLEHAPR